MKAMQQLPTRTMRMEKEDYPYSVYYVNKSRHAQWYDKKLERLEKGKEYTVHEEFLVRQEVQCHSRHIKYMAKYKGVPRTWDTWVSVEREEYYLTHARPVFPVGDFYSMDKAEAIINASSLTPYFKRRLIEVLALVHNEGYGRILETDAGTV